MTYTVRLLRRAQDDLFEIYEHISVDSPGLAVKMTDRLLDRLESLDELPDRGSRPQDQRLRKKGYRFLVEKPYLIFYKVGPSQVWVHRILHGKRAYDRIL